MDGNALSRVIVPDTPLSSTVSEPLLLPAAHSPPTAPEDVLLLAELIASRRVHKPSVPFAASDVLLTVIVFPVCGTIALFADAGFSQGPASASNNVTAVSEITSAAREMFLKKLTVISFTTYPAIVRIRCRSSST
jgi:hypothetical protein